MGEDDKDIIGIWSCTSCRMLPTLVERLLEKTSMLESLVVKLERSNQQLLSLMGEQSQEIRRLREDIATSKRQDGDADSNDGGPQAVTLLVGLLGFMTALLLVYLVTCLLGCMVVWLLGYFDAWLLGYLVVWLLGYLVA